VPLGVRSSRHGTSGPRAAGPEVRFPTARDPAPHAGRRGRLAAAGAGAQSSTKAGLLPYRPASAHPAGAFVPVSRAVGRTGPPPSRREVRMCSAGKIEHPERHRDAGRANDCAVSNRDGRTTRRSAVQPRVEHHVVEDWSRSETAGRCRWVVIAQFPDLLDDPRGWTRAESKGRSRASAARAWSLAVPECGRRIGPDDRSRLLRRGRRLAEVGGAIGMLRCTPMRWSASSPRGVRHHRAPVPALRGR